MDARDLWKVKEEVYRDLEAELEKTVLSPDIKNLMHIDYIKAVEEFYLKMLLMHLDEK